MNISLCLYRTLCFLSADILSWYFETSSRSKSSHTVAHCWLDLTWLHSSFWFCPPVVNLCISNTHRHIRFTFCSSGHTEDTLLDIKPYFLWLPLPSRNFSKFIYVDDLFDQISAAFMQFLTFAAILILIWEILPPSGHIYWFTLWN